MTRNPTRRPDDQPNVVENRDGTWSVRGYARPRSRNPDGSYAGPQWFENINRLGPKVKVPRR